jgi:curli biogenesis system outer membrane secretion channel CsgG
LFHHLALSAAGNLQMSRILRPRIAIFDFYDEDLCGDVGRDVAVRLASQLTASGHYRVVERNEWHRLLGGRKINQNCLLHPAWATQIGNWVSADAVVIGRVCESAGGQMTIATTMIDAIGVALVHVSSSTVEGLSAKLSCSSLVNNIQIRYRPIRARVVVGGGALIILDVGTASELKSGALMEVDRILETATNPYNQDRLEALADLTVGIGTAEVLEIGSFASLARYIGSQPARPGDLASLLTF